MKDFPVTEALPAEVGQGPDPTKDASFELAVQVHEHEAAQDPLKTAKATQREFVIHLYVTSGIVIAVLSAAIYLMMRLS